MRNTNVTNTLLCMCLLLLGTFAMQAQDDVPPNPEFGKCYAKCRTPDKYETVTEQVLVKEESRRLITSPPVYETQTEKVLLKEASTRIVPVPAVYETVSEQILVKPASVKKIEVPAVYETLTERILVKPESGRWEAKRVGDGGYSSAGSAASTGGAYYDCYSDNPNDCVVKCWVKVPAEYRTVEKRVLKTPATTKDVEIQAEYKTVSKQVVKTPATTKVVEIAAEYQTVSKQVLTKAADTREEIIPAEYKTITKTRKVSEGGSSSWEEILCKVDISAQTVRDIQTALKTAGSYDGTIDGQMGTGTKKALLKYQEENGLPVGNLNIKTLQKLGIY